jgi:hypothetical protein
MSLHPYITAGLNRQRRADLLAAAASARRARALWQRGRHLLTVWLTAAASALRGRWGGLRLRQGEAETGRSAPRDPRSTSPAGARSTSRHRLGPVPAPHHPQRETSTVAPGR